MLKKTQKEDSINQVRALCEIHTKKERWDFSIESRLFGKLVCSYYPEKLDGIEAIKDRLEHFFSGYLDNGENRFVDNVAVEKSYSHAKDLLKEKIQLNIHDAMRGLFIEVITQTICDLNNWELKISNWNETDQRKKVVKWHQRAAIQRMNNKQGRREDKTTFFQNVYRGFCKCIGEIPDNKAGSQQIAASQINIDLCLQQLSKASAQEKLAEKMRISVNTLKESTKRYEFKHKELMFMCAEQWMYENGIFSLELKARELVKRDG